MSHSVRGAWSPALWLRSLAATQHGSWDLLRSLRAAVSIGVPLLGGTLLGHGLAGLWVSIGCLLLAAGETESSYSERFRQILVVTPIAAAAYVFGFLTAAPQWAAVSIMAIVAFAFGILSGFSSVLSIATMQALLIAALAIGLPIAAPYWTAGLLFLCGAALYSALLGLEALVRRGRPAREALSHTLSALAQFSKLRAQGRPATTADRRHVYDALETYERVSLARRKSEQGQTREFRRSAKVASAVDQLFARLSAADAVPEMLDRTCRRLLELANAVSHNRKPLPLPEDGSLVRLRMLESAIWPDSIQRDGRVVSTFWTSVPVGKDLLMSATRIGLVTGIAYATYIFTPLPRGYWIPLTVALVMKPDLGSVFARAVRRSAGTILGAGLAVFLAFLAPDGVWRSVLVLALGVLLPWSTARGYTYKAIVMTPLIILMIDAVTDAQSAADLVGTRVLATTIGGLIVIVFGYIIWPSSRTPDLSTRVATVLDSLADYSNLVAAGSSRAEVMTKRRSVYRSLSNMTSSLQRLLAEPPPAGVLAKAWLPVVEAAGRIADRITEVSARRTTLVSPPSGASLSALAEAASQLRYGAHSTVDGTSAVDRRPPFLDASETLEGSKDSETSNDPLLDELADEITTLRGMLEPSAGRHGLER